MNRLMKRILFASLFLLGGAATTYGQDVSNIVEPASRPEVFPPMAEWNPDVLPVPGDDPSIVEFSSDGFGCSTDSPEISCEASKLYRFSFKASYAGDEVGSCAPCGIGYGDCDFDGFPQGEVPEERFSLIVRSYDETDSTHAKLSRWNSTRRFRFSDARITAVQPVFKGLDAVRETAETPEADGRLFLPLGAGEKLDETGRYQFDTFRSAELSGYDRPLFAGNTFFKTDRWAFMYGSSLTYRFALEPVKVRPGEDGRGSVEFMPRIPFTDGSVFVDLRYIDGGKLHIEGSVDGENWRELHVADGWTQRKFELSPVFDGEPHDVFYLRFWNEGGVSQVSNITVELQTEQDESSRFVGNGDTYYCDLDAELEVPTNAPDATPWCVLAPEGAQGERRLLGRLKDGGVVVSELGSQTCPRREATREYNDGLARYSVKFARPAVMAIPEFPFFRQDYSSQIAGAEITSTNDSVVDLSWTIADRNVPRDPEFVSIAKPSTIRVCAPKNGYESFQLILMPKSGELSGLNLSLAGDLVGPDGATISRDNVELFYEYYHETTIPTDRTCAPGWYPDALVPVTDGADGHGAPLVAERDRNFTFFTTVYVPATTPAGVYHGVVNLAANDGGWRATIPFEVEVWDFALPVKNTIMTAYGYGDGIPFEYHNCHTDEERHMIFDKYLEIAEKYRLSPCEANPLDRFDVKWFPDADPPCCEFDFTRYDAEIERLLAKYHFTKFRVELNPLCGNIEGYGFDTPEYQSMVKDFLVKLQAHLEEKGWLDLFFGLCWDEPDLNAYEGIARALGLVRQYAPKLRVMLTEEPNDVFAELLEKYDARLDYWVPLASNYSSEQAAKRKAKGEESWIYICTGPKAPYCTEFIDHPRLEERIRFWQIYERGIIGDLMWAMTYWNCDGVDEDNAQDPYLDPASYIPFAAASRASWGNGDGRFLYPPLVGRTPGREGGKLITTGPNPSLRLDAVRAGIQDFETLTILKKLASETPLSEEQRARIDALFDFSAISADMTHFTNDPLVVMKQRRQVAEAIVELQKIRNAAR